MPLFNDNLLATYRTLQEDNMESECDLITFALERTAAGGADLTPFIAATVPCRLAVVSGQNLAEAEQQTERVDFLLFLPAVIDVSNVSRATVRGETDGVSWTRELVVEAPLEARTYSACKKLKCRLATDTITPPPQVASVTITEA